VKWQTPLKLAHTTTRFQVLSQWKCST